MSKQEKIGLGICILALLLFAVLEYNRKMPADWSSTFSFQDKIPFGLYVLKAEQHRLFPNNQEVKNSFYEAYPQITDKSNFIIINPNPKSDQTSINYLLKYVEKGNSVFMAVNGFPKPLADTLKLRSKAIGAEFLWAAMNKPSEISKQQKTYFTDKSLQQKSYNFHQDLMPRYVKNYQKSKTTVLGKTKSGKINFIRVQFGKGAFYFHLVPHAFTNYYLLNENRAYATTALSYLPNRKTYWDTYSTGDTKINHPLRYIFKNEALKWSYLILLFSLLIYLFIGGKRRQRAIPVVLPPKNDQLDFAKTLGRLYFQQGNHLEIAQKKSTYFLAHIKSNFRLSTESFDAGFQQKLAEKSGKELVLIQEICQKITLYQNAKSISATELVDFSNLLQNFYKNEMSAGTR